MTLSEFKAWFEGFTENLDGAPSAKQFEKIKAKVGEISSVSTTYPIFVDRYVSPYRPYWDRYWATTTYGTGVGSVATGASNAVLQMSVGGEPEWNSHAAMRELGKMEASH